MKTRRYYEDAQVKLALEVAKVIDAEGPLTRRDVAQRWGLKGGACSRVTNVANSLVPEVRTARMVRALNRVPVVNLEGGGDAPWRTGRICVSNPAHEGATQGERNA